ncbi:MAG: hypothetical protein WAQ99_03095 [Pyrinomonadaceae bacterium]
MGRPWDISCHFGKYARKINYIANAREDAYISIVMLKRREYAFHLTGAIALLASLIGAYVSFSKLFSWSVLKGSLDVIEAPIMLVLLLGVFKFVSEALFYKGSAANGKEAKSKR